MTSGLKEPGAQGAMGCVAPVQTHNTWMQLEAPLGAAAYFQTTAPRVPVRRQMQSLRPEEDVQVAAGRSSSRRVGLTPPVPKK